MEKVRPMLWPTLGSRTAKEQNRMDRAEFRNEDFLPPIVQCFEEIRVSQK